MKDRFRFGDIVGEEREDGRDYGRIWLVLGRSEGDSGYALLYLVGRGGVVFWADKAAERLRLRYETNLA